MKNDSVWLFARLSACVVMGVLVCQHVMGVDVKRVVPTYVRYEDFGAKGDGKTDDLPSIVEAHAYANEHNLPVHANDEATYYIGGKDQTAIIQTDTDFGDAKFIIDDREVDNIRSWVFMVTSKLEPVTLEDVASLRAGQAKIDVPLQQPCLIQAVDSNVKRYIRWGNNQNSGKSQTDVFLVNADGNVDPRTPILWDFKEVTEIQAFPIDSTTLTITGGHFTTIANQAESKYNYHARGITVRRSNVKISDIQHHVTGEGDHGAPYSGFLNVSDCANVTISDAMMTGRKTYRTIGSAGRSVSMGSYDLHVSRSVNVSFINCRQTNDINDRRYWGIFASNYCKNLQYDGCELSRFDAHMGVYNATIRNSKLGHAGINAIGHGALTVENTTITSGRLVNLRQDYGSTWKGEFIIRDCTFIPGNGNFRSVTLINGRNLGEHDFGYTCYMPERITIDGLRIDDSNAPEDYEGPVLFDNLNPNHKAKNHTAPFPIVRTEEVILRDLDIASGKPLRVSENLVMFADVKIIK